MLQRGKPFRFSVGEGDKKSVETHIAPARVIGSSRKVPVFSKEELESMLKGDLIDLCILIDLETGGTAEALRTRLMDYYRENGLMKGKK